jgi:hypothetical protein
LDIALNVSLHVAFYVPRTLLNERRALFFFLIPTLKGNAFCHASRPSVEAPRWRGDREARLGILFFSLLAAQADGLIKITT